MSVFRRAEWYIDGEGKRWARMTWRATGNSSIGDRLVEISGLPVAHKVDVRTGKFLVGIGAEAPFEVDATRDPQEVNFVGKENQPWSFKCLTPDGGFVVCDHDPDNPADFAYVAGYFEEREIGQDIQVIFDPV